MGIAVLLVLVAALFVVRNYLKDHETTEISGIVSEEKAGIFENQKVKDILALKYGLKVSLISPQGNNFNREEISFIWHGGEYYKTWIVEKEKLSLLKEESLFATFLVFYAWKGEAENLERKGLLVKAKKGPHYLDLKKFAHRIFSPGRGLAERLSVDGHNCPEVAAARNFGDNPAKILMVRLRQNYIRQNFAAVANNRRRGFVTGCFDSKYQHILTASRCKRSPRRRF